jgi:GLPGLI family protein
MKPTYKLFPVLFLFFLVSTNSYSQYVRFPSQGVIEFEKSVNMYALIKKLISKNNESYLQQAFDQYKKTQPQFKVMKSTLTFAGQKTLFVPEAESTVTSNFLNDPMAQQVNTVFTDLSSGSNIIQKKVFEENFLVKDSVRKINWKITTETREIAGYLCRRANALIMDSIYVVAFYTDKIPVSGGPETFAGLPGMILGVALPYDNVTWFAKSVTDKSVPATAVNPPAKGKATDIKGLIKTMTDAMKDWGDYAKSAMKAFLL